MDTFTDSVRPQSVGQGARRSCASGSYNDDGSWKAPSPETIATALGHEPFQAGVALAKPPPNALDVLLVKTKSGFKTTKRLADQLETYLKANGDDVASQVSLVDDASRRKILALGDGPAPPWDSHTTVWDRMLACGDGTALLDVNTSTQIPYDQFHRASKFVANSIRCQPGDRIAIVMRRCLALPAAVYGVVGAGGAYVPVDPDYPHERRVAIFEDSEPVAVVLTAGLEDKVPVSLPTVVVDDTIYDAAVTPVIQHHHHRKTASTCSSRAARRDDQGRGRAPSHTSKTCKLVPAEI